MRTLLSGVATPSRLNSRITLEPRPAAVGALPNLRVGWTLIHEFHEGDDIEPYEYVFEWQMDGEAIYPAAYTTGRFPN